MKQPDNSRNPSPDLKNEQVLTEMSKSPAPETTPRAFQLNGGSPISLGYHVNLNLEKFNRANLEAIMKSPDERVFPAGLGKMNVNEVADFIAKVEVPLFNWLGKQENLVLFTTNPIQCVQKMCNDNKIAMPDSMRAHVASLVKMKAQPMRGVPGIRFSSVTASMARQRQNPNQK
jgi:hypothetical protein